MRRTVLAIAAILAATGFAAAKAPPVQEPSELAACANTHASQELDCTLTGSIELSEGDEATRSNGREPRMGIDISPWIVPSFN